MDGLIDGIKEFVGNAVHGAVQYITEPIYDFAVDSATGIIAFGIDIVSSIFLLLLIMNGIKLMIFTNDDNRSKLGDSMTINFVGLLVSRMVACFIPVIYAMTAK